ncbi:hypothetical protein BDR26DRAFT_388524 [Obelidium mucronatum]|nr:hypothetical protein BDR26DRAFT_388524 [Obelidium mucronatum]
MISKLPFFVLFFSRTIIPPAFFFVIIIIITYCMKKSLPPLLHKTRPQSACSADTQHNELPAARKLKGLKNTDHIQGDLSLSLLQTRLDLLESTCSRLKIELRQKDAKLTDAVKCQNDLAKTVESLEFRFEFLCSKVNAIEGRACSASTMSSEASFLYPCENNAANLLLNRATEYIFPGDGDSVNSSGFPYDIRIFLQRIKELNQIAGEGISIVTVVDGTSRLKTPEKLTLSLYKNGIILQNGAFRDYKDPSAKLLMKDIMDGFFPYELKDLHPEGG